MTRAAALRSEYRWGRVPARAGWAFAWLLVFIALVYTNPSNLFPAIGDYGYAKMAAGVAIAALVGSWLLMDRRLVLGGTIGLCLTLFFAGVALSAIWSPAPSLTLRSFVEWVKYLAIFYLVANVVDDRRRVAVLAVALAWATVVPAVGTIHSWSRGEHLVEGDRAAWIGVFNNPNELAYYLAIGGAFALGALALTRRRWLRFCYFGALILMATALLLTQSRGGLMAAITVLGLTLLRSTDPKNRGALVAVGVVLLLALQFTPQKVWQRASTTFAYQQDASAQGRIDAWRTGLRMVAAHPLTGVGAGVFVLAWPEYAPGDAGEARTAHNTFVQVASETGLPGLGLFLGAVGVAFAGLQRVVRRRPDLERPARTTQIGLVSFLVSSATGGLAYSWPLYLLLGLAAGMMRMEREALDVPGDSAGEGVDPAGHPSVGREVEGRPEATRPGVVRPVLPGWVKSSPAR
ncbi:MAG TPA: O-antigen ligase family protein [Polyangia bacterium]|jgi:probable O-glycosylation ligase (exosortase A-associated)|nr:O-antigen ligase family protein [Polyangia bacterium]